MIRLVGALLVTAMAVAMPISAGAQSSDIPRGADGRPDLQGVWDFRTLTPLERPADQADQALLSSEEVAEIESNARQRAIDADRPTEVRTEPLPVGGNVGGYNNYWFDRGAGVVDDGRTALIVDPPHGRVPDSLSGVARQSGSDTDGTRPVRFRVGGIASDGPEDRGLAERCLLGFNTGPPIVPGGYNQNIQIFQTADHVVILNEMVHDSRIVPLDGRDRLPDDVRQWMGSSIGRWEDDTLVIETKNFLRETSFRNSSKNLHLIERIQRQDEDTLVYTFTVTDPTTWTQPWTVELPMRRSDLPMFEYACHEGNYGMDGTLTGARAIEKSGE